jgi:hypothetical protein
MSSTPAKIHGHCLCNAVHVSFTPPEAVFDACHCGMCRRWGGGPALTVHAGADLKIAGEDHVTVYASSDWATRAFCKTCGTHLYYKLNGRDFYTFALGLFDDAQSLRFKVQIFVDHKPTQYNFAEMTEMMTEAQVLAKHGA